MGCCLCNEDCRFRYDWKTPLKKLDWAQQNYLFTQRAYTVSSSHNAISVYLTLRDCLTCTNTCKGRMADDLGGLVCAQGKLKTLLMCERLI